MLQIYNKFHIVHKQLITHSFLLFLSFVKTITILDKHFYGCSKDSAVKRNAERFASSNKLHAVSSCLTHPTPASR